MFVVVCVWGVGLLRLCAAATALRCDHNDITEIVVV